MNKETDKRLFLMINMEDWASFKYDLRTVVSDRIEVYKLLIEIENKTAIRHSQLIDSNKTKEILQALKEACERMERARSILRSENANWGMLDTSDLIPIIKNAEQ